MKKFFNRTKENLTKSLELPENIMLDKLQINIIENKEISIENHKGIISYTDENIKINSGCAIISICGENLFLSSLITEEILIKGDIYSIEFIV